MVTYRSTSKYKFLSMIGILTGIMFSLLGLLSVIMGEFFGVFFPLLPGILLLYLLLYVFPDKISVDENKLEFFARLRRVKIEYSNIVDVKPHYTTRTLILTGENKEEAAVYYSINIKGKALSLLLFGSGIYNYRELYRYLLKKIGNGSRGSSEGRG